MTCTLVATSPTPDKPELTEAELFFKRDALLFMEDPAEAEITGIARAGAERLGWLAGLIFEWDTRWIEGIEVEHVIAKLGSEVLCEDDYFADFTDDDRRVVEADLINDKMLDRLIVEVANAEG